MTDPRPAHSPPTGYRRTPIAERSLAKNGDLLERFAATTTPGLFARYEDLWRELVWDITDRDFTPQNRQPRAAAPEDMRLFAQAHYTFLRSLLFVERSIAFPQLSYVLPDAEGRGWVLQHPLELQYQSERFLNIYVHFGRTRDMTFQMLETIGRTASLASALRKKGEQDFDSKAVLAFIRTNISNSCASRFASWCTEVTHYRNIVHKIASAVFYSPGADGTPQLKVLRPALVQKYDDWSVVLSLPPSSFVPAEEIMRRHLIQLQGWGEEIWDFFLGVVRGWATDEAVFRRMLNLPPADSAQSQPQD